MTRAALVTIAHGRHAHWRMQRRALERSTRAPDAHVLVAMDDPALVEPSSDAALHMIPLQGADTGLPLAAARNLGAAEALRAGADVLIFLDVDCLPAPALIEAYIAAATRHETRDRLLCGPVTYLAPPSEAGYDLDALDALDDPHAGRPAPDAGSVILGGAHELFWSLSFAVTAEIWHRIGGFEEAYTGYGAEDTDFGQRAAHAGVDLAWIGAARAYHQHHETTPTSPHRVDDIVRNANTFARRWGWWPMQTWLDGFVQSGLVIRSPSGAYVPVGGPSVSPRPPSSAASSS